VIPAILTALSALFSAVGKLFEFLYARQMVDAGKVQERLDALRKQVKDAQIAVAAREAIRAANAGGVSIDDKDPFIRD
jgi:membrane protease subunit (stomatin/prohibitin family)